MDNETKSPQPQPQWISDLSPQIGLAAFNLQVVQDGLVRHSNAVEPTFEQLQIIAAVEEKLRRAIALAYAARDEARKLSLP
jgi:hypothetical protein